MPTSVKGDGKEQPQEAPTEEEKKGYDQKAHEAFKEALVATDDPEMAEPHKRRGHVLHLMAESYAMSNKSDKAQEHYGLAVKAYDAHHESPANMDSILIKMSLARLFLNQKAHGVRSYAPNKKEEQWMAMMEKKKKKKKKKKKNIIKEEKEEEEEEEEEEKKKRWKIATTRK